MSNNTSCSCSNIAKTAVLSIRGSNVFKLQSINSGLHDEVIPEKSLIAKLCLSRDMILLTRL